MFISDLHIHSKYSRATSRDCVPEYLDLWARKKGIALIGTGDFTHPAWRAELREKLTPSEEGLYALKEEFRLEGIGNSADSRPRFMVSGEISTIYKKNGRVRKVHSLILLPGLDEAEELSARLMAIGNIRSDGRPILGLDCRDLLEITLSCCPSAVFIPAHIWTPHFSLFGAFSGFDSLEECFDDMSSHIHALETGLSSDPSMNWRVSALDSYVLVSNSDAHSPSKLGREANIISTDMSYPAVAKALNGQGGLTGTIEFFPEEGKYHYDGHRACGVCLSPLETKEASGRCPICGKRLTIGVQHRVDELADRNEGFRPDGAKPFESLAPLPEVIAASTGCSTASVKASALYELMLRELGPEFYILREAELADIGRAAGPCVEEGIRRLRMGRVQRTPGYDGEYGKIELLSRQEIDTIGGQLSFLGIQGPKKRAASGTAARRLDMSKAAQKEETKLSSGLSPLDSLNETQRQAVTSGSAHTAVIAGPGTGKTKTLVSRIVYLINERGVKPSEITAVTFTNKAALEMKERIAGALGNKRSANAVNIGTFHSICLKLISKHGESVSLIDEYGARETAGDIIRELGMKLSPSQFLLGVSSLKCDSLNEGAAIPEEALEMYQQRLMAKGVLDFDDLLLKALGLYEKDEGSVQRRCFSHILADEFQDINSIQYRLINAWGSHGKSIFIIGDPDQSIYGFRGSDPRCFERFKEDFPDTALIRLTKNYRSTSEIVGCAAPLISKNRGGKRELSAVRGSGAGVRLIEAESALSEAIFVAKEINRIVGGMDMLDSQRISAEGAASRTLGFSDIAVLYRTHRQADLIERCLQKESVPYVVSGRDDFLMDRDVRSALCFFRFLVDRGDVQALEAYMRTALKCHSELISQFVETLFGGLRAGGSGLTEFGIEAARAICDERADLCASLIRKYVDRVKREKPRKLLEAWAEETGLSSSAQFKKLINTSVFYKNMESFMLDVSYGQEGDVTRSTGRTYPSGAVRLMTLHGSKGLEFPVVFLCGAGKGCIPLEAEAGRADIEEERRLFFVGTTRARDELILLHSGERTPFFDDMPAELISISKAVERKALHPVQLSLL